MLAHIDNCRFCQAAVNQLKIVLAKSEEHTAESIGQTNSAVTANLSLHFAYTGALVTCKTIRPFLASLADPALAVGMPTPITVHLDKCQQCANDTETIRQLNLSHKQLCRLSQLFAEESAVDAEVCAKTRNAISSVGAMVFSETNAEVLRHLCTCPDCRELLYKDRQSRGEKLSGNIKQSPISCDAISATDIFDYVVPYGFDPENDQYAMFRQSLPSHLINCAKCLSKMQQLHNTVYGILERRESGIVTCFKMEDTNRDSTVVSPDEAYKDWPIKVQVFDKSKLVPVAPTGPAEFPTRLKQKVCALNLKQFVKLVAAAAVISIVALLVFNGPVARAVDLGQIYKALEQIKNVCLTSFVPGKAKPTQKIWISQALNIKMFKTEAECVLWNIKNKSKKSRDLNTGSIKIVELNDDILAKVEGTMDVPWGLLPFNNISVVPEDAKWQQVADENTETIITNTEVYDLMWIEKSLIGSIIHRKWRAYIEIETTLPKRIEWWEKLAEDEEYELTTVINVSYPATVEIQVVIEDAGF